MRLYTVTIACRLNDDGEPDFDVNLDLEDGVPTAVLNTIGTAVQNVGKSITAQLAAGDATITERRS